MGQVELRPDTAYVVVASPEVAAMPFGKLVKQLDEAMRGSKESR